MARDPEAERIEVELLLEAIYARYGCDLRGYARASIERRVLSALAKSGLAHLGDLQHRLLRDPDFFASVLNDLTVQVSGMFRDPEFYRVFRARVVPILRTYPQLRIWHAGCSSGEEAYASAIILHEEGLYERSQIYATDLSTRALAQAKAGVYPAALAETFADNYRRAGGRDCFASYCTQAHEALAIKEALQRNMLFFHHNLVSDYAFGEMHVIFCRNVFIYFGEALRTRTLDKFAQGLCPSGFLCLGDSERLAREDFAEFDAAARIYRHVPKLRLA